MVCCSYRTALVASGHCDQVMFIFLTGSELWEAKPSSSCNAVMNACGDGSSCGCQQGSRVNTRMKKGIGP